MTLRAQPRPGTRFPPLLTWQDERGYTLSDRIWAISEATIARIDELLSEGIARGRSAVDIADDLERFLLPGRRGVTTRRPYGTVGSYDARRLARSEITRANSVSFLEASARNPFVTRIHHRLSAQHSPARCNGTCDALAREDQELGGWLVEEAPVLIDRTHPHCMCTQWAEVRQLTDDEIRDNIEQGVTDSITPLAMELLVSMILGRVMSEFFTRTSGGEPTVSETMEIRE